MATDINTKYLNRITCGDCRDHIPLLTDNSIDLFLSDIPYGINLDGWDVLHKNTNSALLGRSPAQVGKSAFKRRGKPINGWSRADRNIGMEYQQWCQSWAEMVLPKMKDGASLFVFGARRMMHRVVNAFEDAGFLVKDLLAWKKEAAHHRAQRVSVVFRRRGLETEARAWEGWRLGNLAPVYEPIAWFMKPYKIGGTISSNVLENDLGAINVKACQENDATPTNLLAFGYEKGERKIHEAQKPLKLVEFLIKLTTKEGHTVLDPFMGSGTTAIASKRLSRHFIGFEIEPKFYKDSLQRMAKEFKAESPRDLNVLFPDQGIGKRNYD